MAKILVCILQKCPESQTVITNLIVVFIYPIDEGKPKTPSLLFVFVIKACIV